MPVHDEGTTEERLALETLSSLMRASQAISAALMAPLQRDHGLTESQLGVLEALRHAGPLTQGQLCARILRSGSNLTTVVDNLERAALVRRERDATDRRVQRVHLTDRGRALIEAALPAHVERVTRLLGCLTPEERRALERLCARLETAAGER